MHVRTPIGTDFLLLKRWPSKKGIHACLETKIGKIFAFKMFISLNLLAAKLFFGSGQAIAEFFCDIIFLTASLLLTLLRCYISLRIDSTVRSFLICF